MEKFGVKKLWYSDLWRVKGEVRMEKEPSEMERAVIYDENGRCLGAVCEAISETESFREFNGLSVKFKSLAPVESSRYGMTFIPYTDSRQVKNSLDKIFDGIFGAA